MLLNEKKLKVKSFVCSYFKFDPPYILHFRIGENIRASYKVSDRYAIHLDNYQLIKSRAASKRAKGVPDFIGVLRTPQSKKIL